MKLITGTFAVLLLSACATPQETRDAGPTRIFSSARSALVVSNCIANAIETAGFSSQMQYRPTPTGYIINVMSGANTLYGVDVTTVGAGSETRYFDGRSFGGKAARVEMIAACN